MKYVRVKQLVTTLCVVALVAAAIIRLSAATSVNVVFIGAVGGNGIGFLDNSPTCEESGTTSPNANDFFLIGGSTACLPVVDNPVNPAVGLAAFNFNTLNPLNVSPATLAPFDTAVLNVAALAFQVLDNGTPTEQCSLDDAHLPPTAKSAINAFVQSGHKLIIVDSECPGGVDYSWLPDGYKFNTVNAGPHGIGTEDSVKVVQVDPMTSGVNDEYLSNGDVLGDGSETSDAGTDANLMNQRGVNWCVDILGTVRDPATNSAFSGPAHAYAHYGTGLFIYNGLSHDDMGHEIRGDGLRRLWLNVLQQAFNLDNLPCGQVAEPPAHVQVSPGSATNDLSAGDTSHTVVVTITDADDDPVAGQHVTFTIISGPNMGDAVVCVPATCVTTATGQVRGTITGAMPGTDTIRACTDGGICQTATKTWTDGPQPPGDERAMWGKAYGPLKAHHDHHASHERAEAAKRALEAARKLEHEQFEDAKKALEASGKKGKELEAARKALEAAEKAAKERYEAAKKAIEETEKEEHEAEHDAQKLLEKQRGKWQFNIACDGDYATLKLKAKDIKEFRLDHLTSVSCTTDAGKYVPQPADFNRLTGTATGHLKDGKKKDAPNAGVYTIEFSFTDYGGKSAKKWKDGKGIDTEHIVVKNPAGEVVYTSDGALRKGNHLAYLR